MFQRKGSWWAPVGLLIVFALVGTSLLVGPTPVSAVGPGGGTFAGDGGPAIEARLNNPRGVAVDRAGNLYIADSSNDRVRRVDRQT
ncbi:MAG: hypothetical protein C4293_14570, partial [Nitrospiraceae bacterium]